MRNPGKQSWLKDLREFHARVDGTCRSLGRFTATEFRGHFGYFEPMNHGYKSLEDLFVMRGYEHEGGGVFSYKGITRPAQPRGVAGNEAFDPPKIPPNVPLGRLIGYHHYIDGVMRKLYRFSEFERIDHMAHQHFGYYSVEHILLFRGCQRTGDEFIYDQVAALQTKALAVASYFDREFSEFEFKSVYRRFYTTNNLNLGHCCFDSICSLLKSIPGLETGDFGSDKKYVLRKGVDRESQGLMDVQERTDTDHIEARNNVDDVSNRPQEQIEKESRRKFLFEQRKLHKMVDVELSRLRHFTEKEFLERMGNPNVKTFGYKSVTELLWQRGCDRHRGGRHFTYDRRSAHRWKCGQIMRKLRKFTMETFRSAFWDFDNASSDFHEGYKTFHLLMESFSEIQFIKRRGEPEKYIYNGTNEVIGDEEEARRNEKEFEEILKTARTLMSPFTEKDLHNAYGKERAVPVFLETIPGIEYFRDGYYRHDGGSREVEKDRRSRSRSRSRSSDRDADVSDERKAANKRPLGDDKDDMTTFDDTQDPIAKKKKLHAESPTGGSTERSDVNMPEKVPVVDIEEEANSEERDQRGQEMMENRNSEGLQEHEKSSSFNTNSVSEEMVTVGEKEIKEEVETTDESVPNEKEVSTVESAPISTNPSEANPLYERILNMGIARGQWVERQVSAITAGMDQSIQKEGAMGGSGDSGAGCSSSQPSGAASVVSDHEVLMELMSRYHNEFLNALIIGAMKNGVDPQDLSTKALDRILEKNPEP